MTSLEPGVVMIQTGVQRGPRSGRVRVLRAVKSEGGWEIEDVGYWRS